MFHTMIIDALIKPLSHQQLETLQIKIDVPS